ncbi:MAG: hypothetical protein WC510_07555 [Candidatus Omnitrophota bacterium]
MVLVVISIIIIVIGFLIWQKHKTSKVSRMLWEKKQEEDRKSEEIKKSQAEEEIRAGRERRKHQAEVAEMEIRSAEERRLREEELRRKIEKDKKQGP